MLPVVAIVGRPNVGKSTLFNCLTKSRDSLVADVAGVTRDRIYGEGSHKGQKYIAIDTGGLGLEDSETLHHHMHEQAKSAVEQAHSVILVVEAEAGVTGAEEEIARFLRQAGKPVAVAVNKAEKYEPELIKSGFFELGFESVFAISAAHCHGIRAVLDTASRFWPTHQSELDNSGFNGPKVAIVGKPNAGKSTLVNRMLGESRVITSDKAGTTRDSVAVELERDGEHYVLVDTAGVRKRQQVTEQLEKLSVVKSLQAIENSDVVIMLLDARTNVVSQDLRLIDFVIRTGRAMVVAVNKWDGLSHYERDWVKREIDRRLQFVNFARIHFISALHGTGVGELFGLVNEAYASANTELSTPKLTQILQRAVERHNPPMVKGRRIKLRYAHPGGHKPPLIVIHGKQTQRLPESYKRYLLNCFRKELNIIGAPVQVEFKTDHNPYD